MYAHYKKNNTSLNQNKKACGVNWRKVHITRFLERKLWKRVNTPVSPSANRNWTLG